MVWTIRKQNNKGSDFECSVFDPLLLFVKVIALFRTRLQRIFVQ